MPAHGAWKPASPKTAHPLPVDASLLASSTTQGAVTSMFVGIRHKDGSTKVILVANCLHLLFGSGHHRL